MRSPMLLLSLLVIPGLQACEERRERWDAQPRADAPVDMPVEGLTPLCGDPRDEGGEVRLEYVQFPGGNAAARVTAFAYQDPGSTRLFPYPAFHGCTDVTDKMHWPVATNPLSERVYHDLGAVVILGGTMPLATPPSTVQGADPLGRTHPADRWYFKPATSADDDAALYLTEKTSYDVVFAGSDDLDATLFEDVLYLPAAFDLIAPGHAGPLVFPADTPQTFTFTTPTEAPPAGYEVLSLVSFTGANGPAVMCIEPDDGSITVPAAMMDVARAAYATEGTVERKRFTHVLRESPSGECKRLDFISMWSYAETPYTAN